WDLKSGKCERSFAVGGWALGLSKGGKKIICSRADYSVRIYETASGKELVKLAGHTNEPWAAALSPDGKIAVTGGYASTIRVWGAGTGKYLRSFTGVTDYPRCIAWSPDGKRVAVGHQTGTVQGGTGTMRIWDVKTGKEVVTAKAKHAGAITSVSWSKGGKR